MAFIDIDHLSYAYPDDSGQPFRVLRDVSLSIEEGEYVAVLGHNGSGKSTLAKMINMVVDDYTFAEGSLTVDGMNILSPDITEDDVLTLRKNVGMVFQNPDNQLVATIVEEDVAFGPENLGIPHPELRERVNMALETVGMTAYAHHEPHRLSGGQKQRIAIAGVIAMMPRCMIFDESTSMLDPIGRKEVIETIEKLNREKGITVLTITHYMEEAARADRVIVLDDGRLIMDGTPEEIFARAEELRRVGLELPQCTALGHALKARGVRLTGSLMTIEDCVDAICRTWSSRGEGNHG